MRQKLGVFAEPLRERKKALEGVLQDIGIAKEGPEVCELHGGRSHSLAKAAPAYVANDWMHTRWLTTLLAREMLSDLESSLTERLKKLQRWGTTLAVAAFVLGYFTRFWGIVLIVACGGVFARAVWIA